MDGPLMYYSAFNRERPRSPVYRCGFDPERHTFPQYVAHISMCPNLDCEQRLENHKATYLRLTGQHWDERAMMDGNAHPATPSAHPTPRP